MTPARGPSRRSRARQAALQALFEADQVGHQPDQALSSRVEEEPELDPQTKKFASNLVAGVVNNKERIDAIIERTASAWPVGQLAATDRIALEIGIFEVCIGQDVPVEVAINESVELAKTFGGENSAGFVNGVLRTIAEQMHTTAHT
jgi:N utilization substance protein B